MKDGLYYKNIEIGSVIPTLVKRVTTKQMVKWAGAVNEYYEIHYDKDFAIKAGLPGVIVSGGMLSSFLGQMLTEWSNDPGSIRKLSCHFHGMHFPNEDIICRGKVVRKYIQEGKHCIECEIWIENAKAERTITGEATLALAC